MAVKFVTVNSEGAPQIRRETLGGRVHLVVPVVMLTPDVHKGSAGSVLYTSELLSKNPSAWNHFPVVVYHPEANGVPVSARTPDVIASRCVGTVYNASYTDRLSAEAWLDEINTNSVDPRIVQALDRGEKVEVSTGLGLESLVQGGRHGDADYDLVATEIHPDHLAILPDREGACSIKKGCGLLQNSAPLARNEKSFARINDAIDRAIQAAFGYYCYLRDVYDGFFIYRGRDEKLYQKSYSVDASGDVTLGDDNTEVMWVTEYRTVSGRFVGNCAASCKCKETPVDKKQQIDFLLTANAGWEAADRPTLEAMPDVKVKTLYDVALKFKTPAPAPTPTVNAAPPVKTYANVAEYLQATGAPAEMISIINEGVELRESQKTHFIKQITDNPSNLFNPEYLKTQTLDFVRNLAALAGAGQAQGGTAAPQPVPMFLGNGTRFSSGGHVEEPLPDIN